MPSICHGPLAPVLARYTTAYPNVAVRVVEGLSGTLAEWVMSDEVDFAICNRPAATHGLSLRLLMTDRLVLVSARNSNTRRPFAPCTLSEVADLKLVLPSPNHFLRHSLDHHIDRGDFLPATTLEIDGQSATLQFVAQSDWATILPTVALINEFGSPRFTINPIEDPMLSTELYELRSPRRTLSAASERFISMIEAQLRTTPALPAATQNPSQRYRPEQ